jgi:hypothetical protein
MGRTGGRANEKRFRSLHQSGVQLHSHSAIGVFIHAGSTNLGGGNIKWELMVDPFA